MKLTLKAFAGLIVLGGLYTTSLAQDNKDEQIIASVQYEQSDVREALRAVFKSAGVTGYTIDPTVQGTVTANLTGQTLGVVLNALLRQVDATYRVESGIYQVIRKEADQTPANLNPNDVVAPVTNRVIRRIQIKYADPQLIAILIGTQGGSTNFSQLVEQSTITLGSLFGGGGGGQGGGGFGGGRGGGSGRRSGGAVADCCDGVPSWRSSARSPRAPSRVAKCDRLGVPSHPTLGAPTQYSGDAAPFNAETNTLD